MVSIPRSGLGLFRPHHAAQVPEMDDVSIPRSGLGLFRPVDAKKALGLDGSFNPSFGFRPIQTAYNPEIPMAIIVVSIPRSGLGLFRPCPFWFVLLY